MKYLLQTLQKPTRALHEVPKLICQWPLFYLKFLIRKGHNSKTIAFKVIPLVLQLPPCHDEEVFPSLVLIPLIFFE